MRFSAHWVVELMRATRTRAVWVLPRPQKSNGGHMLGKLRPRSAYDMTVSFGARMVALAITAGLLAMAASANADTAIFSKTLAGQPTAGHPQNAALDTSGTLF